MPQTVNQRRKEILESADFHLQTAIDRLYAIWVDICRQHPELGHHLVLLMTGIEQQRFSVQQWFHLAWGGNPRWIETLPTIVHHLRQQRAEWAREVQKCQGFSSASEGLEPK